MFIVLKNIGCLFSNASRRKGIMDPIHKVLLDQANDLIKHAEKFFLVNVKELKRDKLISILNNVEEMSSRYEDFSKKLKDLEYDLLRASFPFYLEAEKESAMQSLNQTSIEVLDVLHTLRSETKTQLSPKVLAEMEVPVFNGTIEPWTWHQWIKVFYEFLEQLDLNLSDLNLFSLKKAFSDEPFNILTNLGPADSKTLLNHLGKIYGNETFIMKNILKSIRRIRIPHFKRQQWQRMEIKTQRLQLLIMKIPSKGVCHEILDAILDALPLEKREVFSFGIKVRSQDQYSKFIFDLLKEIEEFANYSTKKFYQATHKPSSTHTCWFDDDDCNGNLRHPFDEDDETPNYNNREEDDSSNSDEENEDNVDIEAFLEECDLEEQAMKADEDIKDKDNEDESCEGNSSSGTENYEDLVDYESWIAEQEEFEKKVQKAEEDERDALTKLKGYSDIYM